MSEEINSDDEILTIFYEESREHLEGIEDQLLTMEKEKEDVSDDLVNEVFRSIHTIKGGCGFFGLTKLRELTHSMENMLDRIRNKEFAPGPENVNILLQGVDLINCMINTPEETDSIDIDPVIHEIDKILSPGGNAGAQSGEVTEVIVAAAADGTVIFEVDRNEIAIAKRMEKGGPEIYLLEYDLLEDIEEKQRTPLEVITELEQLAAFICCKVSTDDAGDLFDDIENRNVPFYALISTVVESDLIGDFLDLPDNKVTIIESLSQEIEAPTAAPSGKTTPRISEPVVESDAEAPVVEPVEKNVKPATSTEPKSQPAAAKKKAASPGAAAKSEDQAKSGKTDAASNASASTTMPTSSRKGDGSLRVGLSLLDKLMSLTGELVLARNQLLQGSDDADLSLINSTTQKVDLITAELQETVMATRMQSIGIVFSKFRRLVRDLSGSLGKKVELVIVGEEVELDKTIIEAIGDPLTHIVRNSLDHGLETPDVRQQAGKSEVGTLKISACHEAGYVIIEIDDDGAGINTERVKEKAVENGLITLDQAATMSEKEAMKLIFKPGFSTAETITDVSGRGVGMDVVMTNLTKLGGTIEVDSDFGSGTDVRIKLPLTLAIIPSLLVAVAGERYAIPQVSLTELVRIPVAEVEEKIERVGNAMVMRLRGRLLPLVDVKHVLGINGQLEQEAKRPLNVAVVMAGSQQYGLIVDNLLDSSEIVVKPLGRHIAKASSIYAGATILGDGYVALILDVVGINSYNKMADISDLHEDASAKKTTAQDENRDVRDKQSLLLVRNGPEETFGIPLGLVSRIEKIDGSIIERTGGRNAIKYRGDTLPLFSIEEVASVSKNETTGSLVVVVFKCAKREVGLVLSEILDVVDTYSKIDDVTYRQPGIMGSVIVNERITLIIDLYGIVYKLMPHWLEQHKAQVGVGVGAPTPIPTDAEVDLADRIAQAEHVPTVLVVEDSQFFLSQIEGFVRDAGYQTVTALDGVEAWQQLEEHGDKIDIVLTDIEMPNMNGFEFTVKARADSRFADLPILAVTSVAGEEAENKGRSVGLDEYLIKLDRDQILEKCNHYLTHGRSKG